jgi:hypothetical protein
MLLPVGLGLPIEVNKPRLFELIQLASTSVVYIKNVLIFIITILLIDSYKFSLYNQLPLPCPIQNNIYGIIDSNIEYIGIEKSFLYYV